MRMSVFAVYMTPDPPTIFTLIVRYDVKNKWEHCDLKVGVFFVNIFRNFNANCDFSFANFQPKKLRNPSILLSKNEDEKFSLFRTFFFCLMWSTWLDSPGLPQFKNVYGVALRYFKRLLNGPKDPKLTVLSFPRISPFFTLGSHPIVYMTQCWQ